MIALVLASTLALLIPTASLGSAPSAPLHSAEQCDDSVECVAAVAVVQQFWDLQLAGDLSGASALLVQTAGQVWVPEAAAPHPWHYPTLEVVPAGWVERVGTVELTIAVVARDDDGAPAAVFCGWPSVGRSGTAFAGLIFAPLVFLSQSERLLYEDPESWWRACEPFGAGEAYLIAGDGPFADTCFPVAGSVNEFECRWEASEPHRWCARPPGSISLECRDTPDPEPESNAFEWYAFEFAIIDGRSMACRPVADYVECVVREPERGEPNPLDWSQPHVRCDPSGECLDLWG